VWLHSYSFASFRPQWSNLFTLSLGKTGQSAFVLKRREVAVIAHLMGKAFAVAALGLLASFMLGGPWLFH
jgi:hypothetical protein